MRALLVCVLACGAVEPPPLQPRVEAPRLQRWSCPPIHDLADILDCVDGVPLQIADRLVEVARAENSGVNADSIFTVDAIGRTYARYEDDPHAWTLTPAQALHRYAMKGEFADDETFVAGFSGVDIEVQGDAAHVHGQMVRQWGYGESTAIDRWEAELQRVDENWRVHHLRSWRLEDITYDGRTYDEPFWRERDAVVDTRRRELESGGSPDRARALAVALEGAQRLVEAFELRWRIAQEAGALAHDWLACAAVAISVGRREERRMARQRAVAAPVGSVARYLDEGWCRADDEVEPCSYDVLFEEAFGEGEVRGVAIVRRRVNGAAEVCFAVAYDALWQRGDAFADDLELRNPRVSDLDADGAPEIVGEYTQGETAGTLVCGGFPREGGCALIASRVRTGSRVSESRVEFVEGGRIRRVRVRGSDARVEAFERSLDEVLSAAP